MKTLFSFLYLNAYIITFFFNISLGLNFNYIHKKIGTKCNFEIGFLWQQVHFLLKIFF